MAVTAYPKTLSEEVTLEHAIAGRSIARVGEGELRNALNKDCVSQVANPKLTSEMRDVLSLSKGPVLPCIPRIWDQIPNPGFWLRFRDPSYLKLMHDVEYGSAFITRPDSAVNIDTPSYWERVRDIWKHKDAVLVLGTVRSLMPSFLDDAASVRTVWGPRRDAYSVIDRIEEEIGKPSGPIILCLGATATVLAARLAKKGLWALDLGHLGMFMKHQGVYRLNATDLISPEYLAEQKKLHASPREYGGSSHKQIKHVAKYAAEKGVEIILDYGCGQGLLKSGLPGYILNEYDPAIPGKDALPKPADLVVCTDVLEHIEPDKLCAVLGHIYGLAKRCAYLDVALRPADKFLSDGRNAHLIQEPSSWWIEKIKQSGWKVITTEIKEGHTMKVWAEK